MSLTLTPIMKRRKKTTTARTRTASSDFGSRLAELRRLRGLTQIQLAEQLNSTQRAITYYENEAAYPPVATIIELARILDVTTDELLGVSASRRRSTTPDLTNDPEQRRLWKKFQQVAQLTEKDQRAVIRLINSVAEAKKKA